MPPGLASADTGQGAVAWAAAEDMNKQLEAAEKARKDERKQRREERAAVSVNQGTWACREPECGFSAQSKAGLVNHTRQKHTVVAQYQLRCPHCGRWFKRQGIVMHQRYCKSNPAR